MVEYESVSVLPLKKFLRVPSLMPLDRPSVRRQFAPGHEPRQRGTKLVGGLISHG